MRSFFSTQNKSKKDLVEFHRELMLNTHGSGDKSRLQSSDTQNLDFTRSHRLGTTKHAKRKVDLPQVKACVINSD